MTGDVYPQQVVSNHFGLDDLNKKLEEKFGPMSSIVMAEAIRIVSAQLAEGDTVSLDRLGTFSLRLGMRKRAVKEYDEVRSQDISVKGVRFNASRHLRNKIARQEVHILKGDSLLRSTTTTKRWVMFYARVLDDQARLDIPISEMSFSVSVYRMYTGCTDYTARKDLAQFCREGKMRDISTNSVKIYMIVC